MTSNDSGSIRTNDLGWAHLCLAVAHQTQADELAKNGIRTTLLVDADIVISQARPSEQTKLFRALRVTRGRDQSRRLLAAVGAYFFDRLFRSQTYPTERPEQDQWRIAPEHHREVVTYARSSLDELERNKKWSRPVSEAESDDGESTQRFKQLTSLLDRLKDDPWAPIDKDLAALLGLLGVEVDDPSLVLVVDVLIKWMQRHGNHVLGARRSSQMESSELLWPGFVKNDEWTLFRRWRELLAPHCPTKKTQSAIDADARVLAAVTMLNKDWAIKKHRVVLLTGSASVLQAIRGQALDPRGSSSSAQAQDGGDAMCDFIRLPTQVLASPDFGGPGATQRRADLPPVSDLLLDRDAWSDHERRSLFEFIVPKSSHEDDVSSVDDAALKRLNALRCYRFPDYFRECVETSMALQHISTKLSEERRQNIDTATAQVNKVGGWQDLDQQLQQLSEMRQVRMRIELLEMLIATDTTTAHRVDSPPRVNPLRSAPLVDWGKYEDARALSKALAETGASTSEEEVKRQQRLSQLKVAVYRYDPTTYLLVLVFARHYAAQGRWELASNAARYAFKLTQTQAYAAREEVTLAAAPSTSTPEAYPARGLDILGEESIFLDLACRRRGGRTPEDIDKALVALGGYEKNVRAEDVKLAVVRFGVERISLGLTRLFMAFFESEDVDPSLREEAGHLLREALAQMDVLRAVLYGTGKPSTASREFQKDIYNRLVVNVCNLAWLTVGWPRGELKRSLRVSPKRPSFIQRQDEATVARVDDCLKQLVKLCKRVEGDQNSASSFDWLSMVLCALHLAPAELQWHDEAARGAVVNRLKALDHEQVNHPYDKKRVEYALMLADKLSR